MEITIKSHLFPDILETGGMLKMYQEEIPLELEFSLLKKIYKDLLLVEYYSDVNIIFDKYLKDDLFIWLEAPYIFEQFYSRLMDNYYKV